MCDWTVLSLRSSPTTPTILLLRFPRAVQREIGLINPEMAEDHYNMRIPSTFGNLVHGYKECKRYATLYEDDLTEDDRR